MSAINREFTQKCPQKCKVCISYQRIREKEAERKGEKSRAQVSRRACILKNSYLHCGFAQMTIPTFENRRLSRHFLNFSPSENPRLTASLHDIGEHDTGQQDTGLGWNNRIRTADACFSGSAVMACCADVPRDLPRGVPRTNINQECA